VASRLFTDWTLKSRTAGEEAAGHGNLLLSQSNKTRPSSQLQYPSAEPKDEDIFENFEVPVIPP
jgi:hypothetical protein